MFLLFSLFISIFFLIYFLVKNLKINHIVTFFSSLLIIIIILDPKIFIEGTIKGGEIFIYSVFPSLFLFLVIINIILEYNGAEIYSKILGKIICRPLNLPESCSIAIVISALCGYPLGAKYSCELYEKKEININTLQRLLNIATNPSPLFVIGAIGTTMLNNTFLGYMLLLSCYISCIIMSFIVTGKDEGIKHPPAKPIKYNKNKIGIVFKNSIDNSIKTSISIGGFIAIFSAMSSIIKNNAIIHIVLNTIFNYLKLPIEASQGLLMGLLEMTNGCYIISNYSKESMTTLVLISFFLGFGGLSVISQVYSFIYKYSVSFKKYIFYKVIQGFISSIISFFLYNISTIISPAFKPSFNYGHVYNIFVVILLLAPVLFIKLLKILFHTS